MLKNTQIGLILLGVAAAIGMLFAALTMNAGFRFRHPRHPDARIVDRNGRLVVVAQRKVAPNAKPPRAEIPNPDYDFGVLPPHSSVSHRFKILNTGAGPLTLQKGKTSCKCTFTGIPNGMIDPGEEAEIELFWNTGGINSYRQSAEIKTNDPANPRFFLTVRGQIDIRTAIEPTALQLERLEPDQSHSTRVLAYSREWSEFDIRDLECTIPHATVEASPAKPESLKSKGAKAGWWITVNLPEMEPGRFNGAVRGKMISNEQGATVQPIDVHIAGRVLRRLSVYGTAIDAVGDVTLGVVTHGETKGVKLFMKVKDDIVELRIKRIDVQPEYLNVKVEQVKSSSFKGLYSLIIDAGRDAPISSHLGDRHGVIRFEFDHPRIQELKLNVRFAVVAPDQI